MEWNPDIGRPYGKSLLEAVDIPWIDEPVDPTARRFGNYWLTYGEGGRRCVRDDAVFWMPQAAFIERYVRLDNPGVAGVLEDESFCTKGGLRTIELLWEYRSNPSHMAAIWVLALEQTARSSRSYLAKHWRGEPVRVLTEMATAAAGALDRHRSDLWHHAMTGHLPEEPDYDLWFGPHDESDVYRIVRALALIARGAGHFVHLVEMAPSPSVHNRP